MADKILATFKIELDIWQQFKTRAEGNDTNASALLKWFVAAYLDERIDPSADVIPDNLDARLEQCLEPILAELADLRGKFSAIESSFGAMNHEPAERSPTPRIDPTETRPECPECGWHSPKKAGFGVGGKRRWICGECGESWYATV